MIQINPLKSYIDGGVRAALTTPPSASLVFDLPGKAIWVKGVKLKGTDHTYTFSHDNYITLTNTPDSNESEDIKIGVNTSALKSAIDTTYGVVSTTANGLAPKFTSGNKLAAAAATTYYFLGWAGSTLKWYQAPFRNIRINSETTDRLGVNSTDPLIISSGNGISVTWDSTNKKIIITNTKPDVNHNTDRTGIKLATVSGTKKTDGTLILANSTTGLSIQGGTNKFLIGDGTNYIEVPVTPSFTVSNKDATIGTALTTIATIAGVDIKAKIALYSLYNHTHSVKINGFTKTITTPGAVDLGNYLPLNGGIMNETAWIVWPDSGNLSNNNSDVTFPVIRGGLHWLGLSDWVKLFSEETRNDNLDLVLQFGDDNSNGLSIRNASNVQTSYISAGGVITTKTFKGNLDWSYITNKPSSYTPSAHTHAWNSLTHSSTTENQAILTNGSANGWKLYTLNISGWNNAANNTHSHSNKSVLDGITSTLVNNWNTAYNFVNTISGTDTDKVINKWDEIVNFLTDITEDNKLNTLLNSKLSVYELANNTNVGAIKNNGIYYSTSDASSGTLTNSPFNTGFTLINMTSYDGGDDLRRSRLAFNAYGEIKVSNDRGLANTAETWYNILTSKNTYISNGSGIINGTTITLVSNADTTDGVHLEWSGQLTYDLYSGLAAWTNDGKKIKAVNKSLFATSGHTHAYLPLAGGTMTGAINLTNTNAKIAFGFLATSPITGYKAPSLLTNGIGIYSRYGGSSDEGAIIITEDTCVIYNSADTGWNFQVMDKDISTDMTNDATRSFGVNQNHQAWSLAGFVKSGSSDSYVLLGGGGHKAVSDFVTSGHNHDDRYVRKWNGVYGIANKFLKLIISDEKGWIRLEISDSNNSLSGGYGIYIIGWGYHGNNSTDNLTVKCLYANDSRYITSLKVIRTSRNNYDFYFLFASDSSYPGYTITYSNSVTSIDCTVTAITTIPTATWTSSLSALLLNASLIDWSGVTNKPKYAAGDAIGGSANYLRWEAAASSSYARKIPISWDDNVETTTTRFRAVYSNSLTYRTDTNTISSNISGNASTATIASKLGTSTVGAINVPIYLNGGTPTIVNLNSTANNLINNLSVGDSVPTDNDYYISQYVGGGTTTTSYHRRPHSALYTYIKNKAEGTWNISINGNAKGLSNNGDLNSQEEIDNFLTANTLKYATFRNSNFGFAYNDGMILSIPLSSTNYGAQIAFDDHPSSTVKVRSKNNSWGNWYTLLHSGNSSVSGGGSTWGSSITVNINGTSKTLTIPGNPNTDYRVTQSETTTANYRPLVIGYTNVSTAGSGMTGSVTNQVYLSNKFYVQPSTGNLYATTFVGALSGNASSATKLQTARTIWGQSFNGTNNVNGTLTMLSTFASSGIYPSNNYICLKVTNGSSEWEAAKIGTYIAANNGNIGNYPAGLAFYTKSADGLISSLAEIRLVIDANGKVGIGTTLPAEKLDVNGNIISKNIRIWGSEVTNNSKGLFIQASDKTDRAYITYNGNVENTSYLNICSRFGNIILSPLLNIGIGTTSPSYKLHVVGDIYTTTGFKKNGSSNSYVLLGGGGHKAESSLSVANADKVDGYHVSSLWRSDGATWNPNTNVSLNASGNNQEWSFDIRRNGYTGCYWHVWDSALNSLLKVNADNGKVYAPYNFVGNLEGNATTSSKWATARTITLSGSVTGSVSIDGSSNVTLTTTTNHTHNYAGSSSAGGAANSSNCLNYKGTGNNVLTAYQTSSSYMESDASWASYIICNHGDGSSYYNLTIRMPFWGVPQYRRLEGGTGKGWYTFITSENISSLSVNYASSAGNADTVDGLHLYTRNLGINGSSWTFASTATANAAPHIYAATSAGTSGQILKSTGGTPTWINQSDIIAGKVTCTVGTADVFRPIVLTNESNQLYYNTKIKGNYSTGKIQLSGIEIEDAAGNTPLIRFGSANKNSILWKVYSNDTTYANQGVYGFDMTYFGTGSGNANRLVLHADNQNSATKVEAMSITQDGVVTFLKTISGNINGNADTVDGQHFNWNNNKNDHTYLWAASNNGNAYLVHRASISVNYANSAGNADTLDGLHANAFATASHSHPYLPLSGGTMTGVIKSTYTSGSWIGGVTNAILKGEYTGYGAILSMPVKDGRVSLSSYPANDNNIYFGYATTAQINAGTNSFNKQMFWDAANNNLHAGVFTGYLSGNASTASKWLTARTLTIGNTGKSVDGSGNVSWSLAEIGAATSGHAHTLSLASDTGTSSITLAHGGKYKLTAGGNSVIFTLPTDNNTNPTNYYWANIKVSATSNVGTAPQFNKVKINTTSSTYQLNVNGDSHVTGWSRAAKGFYCHDTGVHFTHNGNKGQIAITSNNEFCWGANNNTLYFNYAAPSLGTTVTKYVWNAGSSSTYASHTTGDIILGDMLYQLKREGYSASWYRGRDTAIIRQTNLHGVTSNAYNAVISSKTYNGSWEIGTYSNSLYFSFVSDTAFNNANSAYIPPLVCINANANVTATHFYESSDIRYKKILRNLSINSNTIATLPLFDFEWIENNVIGTGTSALAVLLILPNLVSGTDRLTLDYGVLGTIAGITACKELVTLKSELLQLKEKVKELEDKLRKYENI